MSPAPGGEGNGGPGKLPVRRIPPTHDYARQLGDTGPKDGWTKGPADPGPSPTQSQASFVHLHVHSNFSFLDGGSRIEELVARVAELGQPALALTDHDGLYGAVRFAKACAKHGIKPIFGAEIRVESLLGGTEAPGDPYHLVLLAETREGYANLCRLLSAAHLADPQRERPPTVAIESLRLHADGIICLTACRHGEIGRLIDCSRGPEARTVLLELCHIFGPDHLFVELQYFGYEPHQEARPGQHGSSVYEKTRADGGRLRHRPASAAPGDPPTDKNATPITSPTPAHPPTIPGATTIPERESTEMLSAHTATIVASRRGATPHAPVEKVPITGPNGGRHDLPEGQPQRLNPSDYDVGFHRDGLPWRLSCLTYCLDLAYLAAECGVPTVLTTNVHYAAPTGRAIHLICRAAGHDQPLSGYPEPVSGARGLKSKQQLEHETSSLLALVRCLEDHNRLHNGSFATLCAVSVGSKRGETRPADGEAGLETGGATVSWLGGTGAPHPLMLQNGVYATDVAEPPAADFGRGWEPLAATWHIAQRCNVDLELGTYHFPRVEVPGGETAYSLLAKRCFRGIARKYRPVPPRAVELLEKELRMIEQMEFAHYFLVVHDIVRWARARGVACSGRGSAGNSIVCHALDITASEPIRHNLLFERFLNPNRREMPDIDVDFCSSRRDEVIEHIYQTFGNENVAVVANVNTMSPRSAVRIVAEALGFAPTEIDALAKHVPRHGDAARIREYLAGTWPELRDSPLQDGAQRDASGRGVGRYGRFLDLVERLDSFPLHLGTHLGGFVIADRPITYYAPLQWAAKGVVVMQFNKDDVAALGLVKMDILGLRTHSAVSECVHIIRRRTGKRIRPYDLPPDDPAAYEIISNGGSIGLFQLESAGQRNLASRLQERDFDDVIAAIALYRPGPLEAEMIGPFIDRRWGIEPVVLPHPAMAEALGDTYGVILYQEQVMRVAQLVAGFDLADADSLRRAMTRDRSREEMAKIGETFISRALERGVPEDAAREVFRQLEGFAAYGFNKSHSVCFAVISYATAYLKAYYPAEFLCSVLNNYPMGFYTPRTVLNDARRFGLEVRPMDINLSGRGFTVEDETPPDPWTGSELDPLGGGAVGTRAADIGAAAADVTGRGAATGHDTDLFGAAGAGGAAENQRPQTPYDPFAQAWTAKHDWGLTEADLTELRAEQEGERAYVEALRAGLEQAHEGDTPRVGNGNRGDEKTPGNRANSSPPGPGGAAPPAASLEPGAESPQDGAAAQGRARPGDLLLGTLHTLAARDNDGRARSPRSRAGLEPGACLAPSTGIAPDAARALRVGFSYLRQMGERSLDRIEEERRHGPFESFEDFYLRTHIDYPVAENLIRVGAFDSLEPDRTELLWRLPLLHDRLEALSGSSGQRRGQLRAFFSPPSRAGLERQWSLEDKVRSELELLGLTVSCHPLELYEEELRRMGVRMSYELPAMGDEVPVTVAGVYERAQNPWMRSGKRTMFLTLEDAYGLFECVCFESKLAKIAPVVARASYFLVRGRLQNNHKRGLAIVAEEVLDLEEVLAKRRAKQALATATNSASGTRGEGRSRDGHPESQRAGQVMQENSGPHQEMPSIPDAIELPDRRGVETYGDGTVSANERPPGAGTGAIPKKVG